MFDAVHLKRPSSASARISALIERTYILIMSERSLSAGFYLILQCFDAGWLIVKISETTTRKSPKPKGLLLYQMLGITYAGVGN